MFSLEKRRVWGDLIAAFHDIKGGYEKDGDKLSTRVYCIKTKGKGFKLKKGQFRSDTRKKLFTMMVVKHWNGLSTKMVDVPSLEHSRGSEQPGLIKDVLA